MRRTTVIRQASRALIVILVIITISTIVPTMTYAADTPWKEIEGWTQYSTPTLADINGDGKLEVFVPTNKGKIYGFYENGTAISGWPISLDGRYIASSPAVGDINGDGNVEVVVAGGFAAQPGIVAAYTAAGQKLWELIPAPNLQTTNNGAGGVFASPVLADLNADERLDVLISTYDENIYAINGSTGGPLFPPGLTNHNGALINMGDSIWATPAVGDVDGDGSPDIVVASATNHFVASVFGWTGATSACTKNNSITNPDPRACGIVAVYSNTGVLKPGWPKFMAGQTYDASPALVDVNKDGKLEIVTGNGWDPTYGDATQPFYVTIWNYDGTVRARYDVKTEVFNSPAIGDITGDSQPEIVVTTSDRVAGTTSYQRRIFAFDLNMNLLSGFPNRMASSVSG
ncbi:MAG: VCBS repeat-containing protein, partial [Oscillochloris sp.]|nr:VCBS repeat-containing protein [Oscillochloris sp.]